MRKIEKPMAGLSPVFLPVSLLFMILSLFTPMADGQDEDPAFDPHPLRPADTSSPRDTLRSFLTNVNEVIDGWRRGEVKTRNARAFLRAVETLDLSTTPYSDAWGVRTERILMLKEILDRIDVPPDSAIPGDSEVADGTVTQWTIPDTRITISRIGDGLRAGEFLFSAGTVQRLHRHYAHASHLPYKPGASAGVYEQWTRSDRTDRAHEKQARNRLKPVDTLSPKSTLEGFLDSVNRSHALAMEADAALKATPPTISKQEAREISIAADHLLQRALGTLDLSEVPEALREEVGVEAALQLKEVFDRMQLPPVETVPNTQMVVAAREQAGGAVHWRYPNTEIEIVEITEGERQGQFLFSADTVRRISDFYAQIQGLPYRTGVRSIDWVSPDKSEGFLRVFYFDTGLHGSAHTFPGQIYRGTADLAQGGAWRTDALAVDRPAALCTGSRPGGLGDLPRSQANGATTRLATG